MSNGAQGGAEWALIGQGPRSIRTDCEQCHVFSRHYHRPFPCRRYGVGPCQCKVSQFHSGTAFLLIGPSRESATAVPVWCTDRTDSIHLQIRKRVLRRAAVGLQKYGVGPCQCKVSTFILGRGNVSAHSSSARGLGGVNSTLSNHRLTRHSDLAYSKKALHLAFVYSSHTLEGLREVLIPRIL
jgi:hypothetical protein